MTKKINLSDRALSMLLCVLMLFSMFPMTSLSASAEDLLTPVPCPTVTTIDDVEYYEIDSVDALYWFAGLVNGTLTDGTAKNTSANAILTADITVNSNVLDADGNPNSDDFELWTPIGNVEYPYSGTFDGNNKTVSGLYFENGEQEYVGLFGYAQNGTIKNVGVVDSYFCATVSVGGVVGDNEGGTVTNSYNSGTVTSTGDGATVGGVVGYNCGGTVTNSYNSGTVTSEGSSDCVGGVVGRNYAYGSSSNSNITVTNSYNSGTVTATGTYVGGVVGYNYANKNKNGQSTVDNCYFDSEKCTVTKPVGSNNNGTVTDESVLSKTTEQFNSGEVAYLLNRTVTDGSQTWYQTLSGDNKQAYPQFSGDTVYLSCTTTADTTAYTNTVTADGKHSYQSEPSWIWISTANGYKVTAKFACENCDHTVSTDADVTIQYMTAGDTTSDIISYTATVVADMDGDNENETYTKVREIIHTYAVTLNGGTFVTTKTENFTYGEKVKVKAEESVTVEGTTTYFSGWYAGDVKVSDKLEYTFVVYSNIELTPKYENTESATEQPFVSLQFSERSKIEDKGYEKVSLITQWTLPSDCTFVSAGVVRSYNEVTSSDLVLGNVDGSSIRKNIAPISTRNGTYKLNVTMGTSTKVKTLSAVGYLTYKDANGTQHTIYTSVMSSAPLTTATE